MSVHIKSEHEPILGSGTSIVSSLDVRYMPNDADQYPTEKMTVSLYDNDTIRLSVDSDHTGTPSTMNTAVSSTLGNVTVQQLTQALQILSTGGARLLSPEFCQALIYASGEDKVAELLRVVKTILPWRSGPGSRSIGSLTLHQWGRLEQDGR